MRCIIIDDDILTQNLLKKFVDKSGLITCYGVYNNPLEVQEVVKNKNIDLIFLDIIMPEMSGFDFLDSQNYFQQIIVVSGNEKYALSSFEYGVTDYLLKPFSYERFLKALIKSIDKYLNYNTCSYDECIYVKKNNDYKKIKIDDIHCISLENNTANVQTNNNSFVFIREDQIESVLNKDNFIRINNSLVLNIKHILNIDNNNVNIRANGKKIKVLIESEFTFNLIKRFNKTTND